MKNYFLLLFTFFLAINSFSQTFYKEFGKPGMSETGTVIIKSPDGNFIIGGGKQDSALLMKVDPFGNIIWSKCFKASPSYDNRVHHLAITPDNFLIGVGNSYQTFTAPVNSEGFWFKFDLNGNFIWSRRVNTGIGTCAMEILAKSTTEYMVVGEVYELSNTYADMMFFRIDAANGNLTWSSPRLNYFAVSSYIDEVAGATLAANNASIYYTGRIYVNGANADGMRPELTKIDAMGNHLYSKYLLYGPLASARIYGSDIVYDNDSLVMSYFGDRFGSSTNWTVGITKTDTLGNINWSKDYDIVGSSMEFSSKVAKFGNGYVIFGWMLSSSWDLYIIRTDHTGNVLWSKKYGGLNNEDVLEHQDCPLVVDGNYLYFTGQVNSGGFTNIIYAKVDQNGNLTCGQSTNITINQSANPTTQTLCAPQNLVYPIPTFNLPIVTSNTPINDSCNFIVNLGHDTSTCSPIVLNATTSGATYLWQDGSTGATLTTSTSGIYWVVVKVNCCYATDSITITSNLSGSIQSQTNVLCNGANTGSATVIPVGGVGPFTYAWAPSGGTNSTATGLGANTYTCTITDANGCIGTQVVIITQGPAIVLSPSSTQTTCTGNTGTASVSASGGNPGYTYLWNNSQTTPTATGLTTGTYTVTVTDASGCTQTQTVSVTSTNPLIVTTSTTQTACIGNTGTATANPSNGTAPYTYNWSNSQTNQTATGLGGGTYTITVTDANGCSQTQTVTVTTTSGLTVITSSTQTICTANNGTATATPQNGNSPYTYVWSNSQTNQIATGLNAGTYTVTVTDANGCSFVQTVIVTAAANNLSLIPSSTQAICTSTNGTASVTPQNGTSPYTYVWSNSQTNQVATGLNAGSYTVTVTDANGCTQTQTVVVTASNNPLTLIPSSTQAICTSTNGTATITPTSGTSPYTYVWNNSQTTQTATGLSGGTYTVTVTDANGCTQTQTITVSISNPLTLSLNSTATGCTSNTGTATASPSNGTAPYTYAWSNSQTTQTATGLGVGTYTVTVTDANGCTLTQIVSIIQMSGPLATANANFIIINPGGNSQLTATGGGTYLWSPASGLSCTTCANPLATPAQTTTYCVQVTDVNGCSDSACITIYVEIPCVIGSLEKLLPNAFSPNGDLINDKYCVPSNACIKSFILRIYDRWGEKVFESDDITNCWDGIFNGEKLNTDVFAYYFDAVLSDATTFSQKGNISLVR